MRLGRFFDFVVMEPNDGFFSQGAFPWAGLVGLGLVLFSKGFFPFVAKTVVIMGRFALANGHGTIALGAFEGAME